MKKFEIAVPMTGWQVFQVEAEDAEQAIELVSCGEVDTDDFDGIDWEVDTNKWDIEEID
jgi:hypothetical protein